MKEVILTPEGFKKLKEEIDYLANDKRREVADRIKQAREFAERVIIDDEFGDRARQLLAQLR